MVIIKFTYRYFIRPIKSWFDKWLLRFTYPGAILESFVLICDDRKAFSIGEGSSIHHNTVIAITSRHIKSSVIIGKNTYVGEHNNIRAADGVIDIGNNCLISQGITIVTSNHGIKGNLSVSEQPWISKKSHVIISDGVWIGANAVILPDVTIGEGAVVAAGAIVTKDVPPYAIVAGNPAKIIKFRK